MDSGHQPLVLLHAVERDEGDHDGHGLDVVLIFRVTAVVLVLADLQAAGAAEHDVDDAGVAQEGHGPLACAGETANAREDDTRPEDEFTQVVGAADDTVEAGVHEPVGVHLLGGVLLHVGHRLHDDAEEHHDSSHIHPDAAAAAVLEAVEDGQDLEDIEGGAGNPDGHLSAQRDGLAVLDLPLHVLVVGGAFKLPDSQIAP